MVKVSFLPSGKKAAARRGQTVLEVARRHKVLIDSSCNGKGTCGRCRVIAKANVSLPQKSEKELLSEKEISRGVRLACRARLRGDARVRVLRTSALSLAILEKGMPGNFRRRPYISKLSVRVPEPRLETGSLSDQERLRGSLPAKLSSAKIDIGLLRKLPLILRRSGNKITCVFAGERLIGLEEGDTRGRSFGLSLDIGTTTVVASLIDLNRGAVLGVASQLNPQFSYGEDVISRIHYVRTNPGGLEQLREEIIAAINDLISGLCYETKVKPSEIYELTAAGNSCMLHLLLGVDPSSLAVSPYVPVFREALSVEAAKLGIEAAPDALTYIPPCASGYVGADITAGILVTGLYRKKRPCLLIDIGTNGEVVLAREGKLTACSTAAGPAFEGMNISCSMRAEPGAIEEVRLVGPEINYKTVNKVPPRGLCGSGLLDLIAELLKRGFIDVRGRLRSRAEVQKVGKDPLADRLRKVGGIKVFLAVRKGEGGSTRDIYVSQGDIRKLQLAKGAIYTGIMLLLQESKLLPKDVSRVYIAGGFGYHLRPESLAEIGLIPQEFVGKIVFAGNSASSGARMLLLDEGSRKTVERFSGSIKCLELTIHPNFEKMFIDSLNFK
ncbi:MAG: DUF4445 domain-containing protein [Deltaproteobacteria bacterium]|nr:MAG: DUF4445 domain-containing protein [Deltaproteobacteria bacterium]